MRDALRDRFAGERVEHDVHALAAGQVEHLLGEGERARIHDVLDAERREIGALLGAAGGGEDLGADLLRDLDRRQADAAGRRVDQHPFAAAQLREPVERVVRRHEGARNGGRGLEGHRRGLAHHQRGARRREAGERIRRDRDHLVARREARNVASAAHHPSGAIEPQALLAERLLRGDRRDHSGGQHDVAEIQSGGRDGDLHFVGLGVGPGRGMRRNGGDRTRHRGLDAPVLLGARRAQGAHRLGLLGGEPHHPAHPAAAAAERDLLLVGAGGELAGERRERAVGAAVVEVDDAAARSRSARA